MSEWFFEGSCDTEDWSNDFENVDLPSQKYIQIKNIYFK